MLAMLDGYANWHPFIISRGEATPGTQVDYVFRSRAFQRPFNAAATVLRNEESTALAQRLDVGGFLSFDETFEIEPSGRGSTLRHRMERRGLVRLLGLRFMKIGLRDAVLRTDEALDRCLRGFASSPARPVPGNRIKRRVVQSRAREAPASRPPGTDR